MKHTIMVITATIALFGACKSEETLGEKADAKTNTVKRDFDKVVNRTNEAFCSEELTDDNKLECLAKKAQNRLIETKDAIRDKSLEVRNKIDSNSN